MLRQRSSSSGDDGFYEAFSDLIFAVMAIFVLLTTVFLVLAKESPEVKKARGALKEVTDKIEAVQAERDAVAEKTEKGEATLADIRSEKAEIAVAVDMTGSMEQELRKLTETVNLVLQVLPRVAPEVRIGISAYRINTDGVNESRAFPMRTVTDESKDGGKSLGELTRFLKSLSAVGGTAPVDRAVSQSISMFTPAGAFHGNQILMLLGDVGPYEFDYQQADEMTPQGYARADRMENEVAHWVKAAKKRHLIVIFSGNDEIADMQYGAARSRKHRESRDLFKRIAVNAGQKKGYTENVGNMLALFLKAMVKK